MYLFAEGKPDGRARPLARVVPAIWSTSISKAPAARIFTMPATDPINPNVDPLIYRLNGVYGQSQAAALEAEGQDRYHFQLHLH
jgi:hypothetical protein